MQCVICGGAFYYQTQDSPHDSCDCGQDVTRREAQEMSPEELSDRYARYAACSADRHEGDPCEYCGAYGARSEADKCPNPNNHATSENAAGILSKAGDLA